MRSVARIWGTLIHILSGEWVLRWRANGGDVIIARSLFASSLLFLAFIGLKHALDPNRTWSFSATEPQREAHASLPIWGALLAAVYTSLYARFSAQWNYLAGLYNKLLEMEIQAAPDVEGKRQAFSFWKASFVEDADELHLATKRIFVPAIRDWLADPATRKAFVIATIGGEERLAEIERRLESIGYRKTPRPLLRETAVLGDAPTANPGAAQ